jgi:murein DD-endopeptidase MepM/ murein hydrolase activator NlpD
MNFNFNKIMKIVIFLVFLKSVLIAKDVYIKVYYEKLEKEGYNIYADNSNIIPCYVNIEFSELNNLISSEKLPYSTILEPNSKRNLIVSLNPENKNASYSFKYNFTYSLGNPESKPDDSFAYLFPFEHGKKYHLSQGNNGKFTHFGENQYAFDFEMDVGTPVTAARDGIVVETKSDSNSGGTDSFYSEYANYILIYHSDGTFGNYVHLMQNGVLVKPGDKIKAGDIIGYSGNTGMSSGPHLHFDVRLPTKEGTMQSIPIKFLNFDNSLILPVEGEYYYSFHPGRPEFEIIFGKNITNKDYEAYSKDINATDNIEVRVERIDNTFIFFVQNGFNEEKKVSLEFKLKNLVPSKTLPLTVNVEPKKEVYSLFLRVENNSEPSQYSCEYTYSSAGK